MVVEQDMLVRREQVLEGAIRERMRVRALGAQDHEVRHIHDSNAEVGHLLAQKRCGSDYFEGHLDTYADEDTVDGMSAREVIDE